LKFPKDERAQVDPDLFPYGEGALLPHQPKRGRIRERIKGRFRMGHPRNTAGKSGTNSMNCLEGGSGGVSNVGKGLHRSASKSGN